MNFSFINSDEAYERVTKIKEEDTLFPYTPDMDPRLIEYLQLSYRDEKRGMSFISRDEEFKITDLDLRKIKAYKQKHNIMG